MRKLTLRFTAILLVFLLCGLMGAANAQGLFLPEEIRPGLRGVAKTVISGNTIETFDVEVLGLVPQSPPLSNLIMIRVSGDVIERSGGIAQGMSGSPVYIQDRLLGAIGYTYAQTDHRIGLVTPAVDMFKLYDAIALPDPLLPPGTITMRSPLLVQGLNERNSRLLSDIFGADRVQAMPLLTSDQVYGPVVLQAGSMVGVQLLRGDFQVASFGTVTHVKEDGRFLAFGHPFTHRGKVGFFASAAYVHHTLPSLDVPFKIVSLGSTIGRIEQDRAVGLGGYLGSQPDYVAVNIQVRDRDREIRKTFNVEAVKEPSVMVPLVVSSAYQSVDATLDRLGAGTSFVRLEFTAKDFNQRMIRENLFYSDSDIAVWSLTDLLSGLELLANNNLQEVDLQEVRIEVEVAQERKTARIEKAVPSAFYATAGEFVDVDVTIRPYRGTSEIRTLRIEVPQDIAPGLLTVTVRGGGAGYYVEKPPVHTSLLELDEGDDEPVRQVISGAESLDALITEYMDRERNNEIVVEFFPFLDTRPQEEEEEEERSELGDEDQEVEEMYQAPLSYFSWADTPSDATKIRLATQFVIDGMATFDLNIYN
ncbi:MAG TPA: SpoIVB peptidase S55 domain-containing protein [Limnochordia bacterium]|nr:SpoIVB peptidase S55 domain-containing protein [Limnochordia bacterium]